MSHPYWLGWDDQKRLVRSLSLSLDNWTAIKVTSSPGRACVELEGERRLAGGWLVALIAGLKLSSMTLVALPQSRLICVDTPPYIEFHEGSRERLSAHLAGVAGWLRWVWVDQDGNLGRLVAAGWFLSGSLADVVGS